MYRGIVFCDHSNFQIAVKQYYSGNAPKLDYNRLFGSVVNLVSNTDFLRADVFIPRPDDEYLRTDNEISRNYNWESKLNLCRRVDVVEGDLRITKKYPDIEIDANNKDTYYFNEKGVDISLAINALSMAYTNAYDAAFIMSGDSDFINLYKKLHELGKIVYVVIVKDQLVNYHRLKAAADEILVLDDKFFNMCLRK